MLNLSNVADQAVVTVTLNGLTDSSNHALSGTTGVSIRALYGSRSSALRAHWKFRRRFVNNAG